MYKTFLILIALLVGSKTSVSQPLSISASAGGAYTVGSLGHKSDFGYTGSLSFEYTPDQTNSPELKIIARLAVHKFSTDSETDYSVMSGELGLKLDRTIAKSPNMYLIGTAGLAKTEYEFTETSPLLSVGFGIESGHFVIESRLVQIFGNRLKETTFVPVTVGMRF